MASSPGRRGTLTRLQTRVLDAFRGVDRAYLTGDGGLDAATLAWVLRDVPTDLADLLMEAEMSSDELAAFRDELVERLQERAWPALP